jgi:hypothetical protein
MPPRFVGVESTDPWLPAGVRSKAVQARIDDVAGLYTAGDVEGALAEIAQLVDDLTLTQTGPPGPPGPAGLMAAASDAETVAGVITDKAVTPGSLTAAVAFEIPVDGQPGATDDDRMAAAFAAWNAYTGPAAIVFGARAYTMVNPWLIPNDGAAIPNQKSLIIRGAGGHFHGGGGPPSGGTVVNFTATGPAKIDTRGHGLFTLTDIAFTDTSGGATPFFQTTNTTVIIERCGFIGSKDGQLCDQDAIYLGGGTRTMDGSATAKFDGYKSVVRDCFFNHIRRACWMRPGCNDCTFESNTIWIQCGAPDNTIGAVCVEGTSAASVAGNLIADNTIEVNHYPTAIAVGPYVVTCQIRNNGLYDPSATTERGVYFTDNARYNYVLAGFGDDTFPYMVEHANVAKLNMYVTSHQSQRSIYPQPATFTNIAGAGGLRVEGTAVFAGGLNAMTIQPAVDVSEGSGLFTIRRSAADDVLPGTAAFVVNNNGDYIVTNPAGVSTTWSSASRTMTTTGPVVIFTNASNIDMRGAALRLLRSSDALELARLRASPSNSGRGALQFDGTGPLIISVTGTPEGAVTAPVGSLALRADGGAATTLYVKETGTGNTGWVPK